MSAKPILGVSACLLGHQVRFDGGHKRQAFLTGTLARFFDFHHVCPEAEIGLGVPRPTLQLRRTAQDAGVVLFRPKDPDNPLTDDMRDFALRRVEDMGGLAGFIFKKDSPSCGMERVPVVVNEDGYRVRDGVGLFAAAFMRRWPLVPVEEEGRLNDPALRENFFERVYALRRWSAIAGADQGVEAFMHFHAHHKLMLMARGSTYYTELGRMVAGTTRATLAERRAHYIPRFMEVMKMRPDRGRQVNVMQHVLGYFKTRLASADKQELLELFESYRRQEVPLITPLTLLRHHLRQQPEPYLERQHYLAPYPDALALRSHNA